METPQHTGQAAEPAPEIALAPESLPAAPGAIAHVLESMPPAERAAVLDELPPGDLVEALASTSAGVARAHIGQLSAGDIACAAAEGREVASAQLLRTVADEVRDEALDAMDAQARSRMETLLAFPAGTVGSVMQLDTVAVRGDVSIATVNRYLRRLGAIPSHTNRLMVVDRDNRYRGSVRLGELFLHDPGTQICEILETGVEALSPHAVLRDAARLFEQRDFISLPVVDAEGALLGRVTVDDMVTVIRREGEHHVMVRAGLSEDDDMLAPGWPTARRRMVWLGINLLTALLAAWVIGIFDATIEQVVALAVLMPLVASMGGIAGTQTLTVVVRAMALGRLDRARLPWMLRRELFSAGVNGVVWAVLVGALAVLWFGRPVLGVVVGVALLINQFAAALAGALIPLVLERLKIDPALAGGVILTTVTDVVGFFTLLGLGSVVLSN